MGSEGLKTLVRLQVLDRQNLHYRSVKKDSLVLRCRKAQSRKARFFPQSLANRAYLPRSVLHPVRVYDTATRETHYHALPASVDTRQAAAADMFRSFPPSCRHMDLTNMLAHELSQRVTPARYRMPFRHRSMLNSCM